MPLPYSLSLLIHFYHVPYSNRSIAHFISATAVATLFVSCTMSPLDLFFQPVLQYLWNSLVLLVAQNGFSLDTPPLGAIINVLLACRFLPDAVLGANNIHVTRAWDFHSRRQLLPVQLTDPLDRFYFFLSYRLL